ncbi:guanylate kinase-associated protein mars [Musca domestica]|uniref:Guanylate kinase-associated protein mars n=1 Tax=Musca domestica TaxID=7370 RepID=A0A1I8MJB9_MUSDO|nr:guanylate kinase-associated protein mars [Musca domestica]
MSDYCRSLYKESRQPFTTQQHNRLTRQLQEANRNKQRNKQFQNSRHISVSPTPRKPLLSEKANLNSANKAYNVVEGTRTASEKSYPNSANKANNVVEAVPKGSRTATEKENIKDANKTNTVVEVVTKGSRTAKLICTARDPEKIKKQEAFILRFLDWKDKKKAMMEQKKAEATKKKPFVSAVGKHSGFTGGGGGGNSCSSSGLLAPNTSATQRHNQGSFVPKGYADFQPPPGIKEPGETLKDKAKGRQSIYTVVPTPPKKKPESVVKNVPLSRKVLSTNFTANAVKTKITNKPTQTTNTAVRMPPPPSRKPLQTTASGPGNVGKKNLPAIKVTNTATAAAKSKFGNTAATRKPIESARQQHKKSPLKPQKNARLTQTMKAKKPIKKPNTNTNDKLRSLMVNQASEIVSDMIVQTPRDFSNSNHFEEFVTSTKVKNSSTTLEDIDGVSPIEMLSKRTSSHSTAKRNLLKDACTSNMIVTSNPPIEKKFNFIRYSEVNVSFGDSPKEGDKKDDYDDDKVKANNEDLETPSEEAKVVKENPISPPKVLLNNTLTLEPAEAVVEKTPTKLLCEERPINYLSPFVSVSRGKVSMKKEKERRSSVYVIHRTEEELNNSKRQSLLPSNGVEEPKLPQYSAEVLQTLEAVRYFRKQLQNEIDRLHAKCDLWEEYKKDNLEKLQAVNGDDMIDVTIGQTKLLTSKKFMQFKGLIDRCEARATGINDVPDDGSEKTKNVDAVDLEGFWSMLGLQVDNLEKRFDNLERWKANDWQDPDEVKPKPKAKDKNLAKVKKPKAAPNKARPNSELQKMLRKMQEDMRNKKANNHLANSDVVVLTPSKVRDRKYFSPAPTVLAVPASNRRLSTLLAANVTEGCASPNRLSLLVRKNGEDISCGTKKKSLTLNGLDSPRLSNGRVANAEVAAATAYMSPIVKGRKSILKTPGTGRTKLQNVVFNEKLRVRKFKFIVNDEDANVVDDNADECNKSDEEQLRENKNESDNEESCAEAKLGTYSLRNRKVRLRPSCEIVIPK